MPTMNDSKFQKFFGFRYDDLLANEQGKLSNSQSKKLHDRARIEKKSARDSVIILFIISTLGLGIGLLIGSIAPNGLGKIAIYTGLAGLWPLAWAGRAARVLSDVKKIQNPTLRSVHGAAHLVRAGEQDHILEIESIQFDLDGNPAGILMENEKYTVYYIEETDEILSIKFSD